MQINYWTRKFSCLFHIHNMHLLALRSFYAPKWQISLPFRILQVVKSLPFIYRKPEKGTPFGRGLPVWAIIGRPPRGGGVSGTIAVS